MNELDKIKQAAEKAKRDAANYERDLFLTCVGSGVAVVAMVAVIARLLGWI